MSLSLRFHDKMPVGKLLTRLTSDVDALSEVFGSGAVGVLADFVSLIVISITMILIEWRLGLLLLIVQIPVTLFILWLQKRYRKQNYKVREELSQFRGETGAVNASVRAGADACERVGDGLVAAHIIARPHDEIEPALRGSGAKRRS